MALISGGGGGGGLPLTGGTLSGELIVDTAATTGQALELQGTRTSEHDVFRIDYPHMVIAFDSDAYALFSSNDFMDIDVIGLSASGAILSVKNDNNSANTINLSTASGLQVTTATVAVFQVADDGSNRLRTVTVPPNPATQQLVTATAAQINTGFSDYRTFTPVTFNPTAGASATCLVQISKDNVTFFTLWTETEPAGVAFDGTIHAIPVYLPAGWYIKLTVTNATLGLTTYY